MSEQTIDEVNRLAEAATATNGETTEIFALDQKVDLKRQKATFALENPVTVEGVTYSTVTFDFPGMPSKVTEKIYKTYKSLHPDDDDLDTYKSEEFHQMLVSRACNLPMAVIQAFEFWDRKACQQKAYIYVGERLAMRLIRIG